MTQQDPDTFFGNLKNRLQKAQQDMEQLNATGQVPHDSHMMMDGPAPMYKSLEKAKKVLEDPRIQYVDTYVKKRVMKKLRGK